MWRAVWGVVGSLLLGGLLAQGEAAAIRLDWDYTQGSEPAIKFRVLRQAACTGAFAMLAEVEPVTAQPATYTYRDTTALAGHTYCWQVTALSVSGKESAPSNGAQFSVPGVVEKPVNLRLTLE